MRIVSDIPGDVHVYRRSHMTKFSSEYLLSPDNVSI